MSTPATPSPSRLKLFFHVVSNIRPIVWIGFYVCLVPVFALIYWALPDGQFRIPDGAGTDFGSWLYYSIVTITTLGFGDYTPAHGIAQAVTAIEVMCGLLFLGFFLNAVGSMKSEIDVQSEIEKQRLVHDAAEKQKLIAGIPSIIHNINLFLAYCYAVTTPVTRRTGESTFNPGFTLADMADLYQPSGLPSDRTSRPAVSGLLSSASRLSLCLDSLQSRVDLSIWPQLMENCFTFVADSQIFSADDVIASAHSSDSSARKEIAARLASVTTTGTSDPQLTPYVELASFIRTSAKLAESIETDLTAISTTAQQ